MKNITKFFALAVVILGFSANSFGQTATLNATATVSAIAEVTPVDDLNFGSIGSDANGGLVTMSTLDVRGGGAILLPDSEGNAGEFTIEGTAGDIVNLTMPGATTVDFGEESMSIDTWVFNIESTAVDNTNDVAIPVGGVAVVKIGATLHVGTSQAVGSYEGTYEIIIALN